jgi:hypothetical protein
MIGRVRAKKKRFVGPLSVPAHDRGTTSGNGSDIGGGEALGRYSRDQE